jgi:hypothetical protein
MEASNVLRLYLSAVEALPDQDIACAKVKLEAHQSEDDFAAGKEGEGAWLSDEVQYLQCASVRAHVIGTIQACRNEALSYLVPNSTPPVEVCEWRSSEPLVKRK